MEAKQGGESVMNPFVSLHTVDAVFDGIAVREPRVRVIYCQDPAVFRYLITGEFFCVIRAANIGRSSAVHFLQRTRFESAKCIRRTVGFSNSKVPINYITLHTYTKREIN